MLHYLAVSPAFSVFEPLAFGADFWLKKKPGDWSSDEVEHMKTKSPWARKVQAEVTGGVGGGRRGGGGGRGGDAGGGEDMGGGGGGRGGGSGGGGGGGGRGGGRGGGDLAPSAPSAPAGPELIIRWETAAPMLAATHMELPESFKDLYAISVTGLPPQLLMMALNGGGRGRGRGRDGGRDGGAPPVEEPPVDPVVRQKQMIEKLLSSVTLSAKGRDPQSAVVVQQTKTSQALIFGFERTSLPLTVADKDVQFTIKLGVLTAKAKFEPKDMMFDGKLAM